MIAPQRLVAIPFVLLPLVMGLTACLDEDDHSNESSDTSELVTITSTTTPPPTSTVVEETTEVITVYADGNGNVTDAASEGTQNSGSSTSSNVTGNWLRKGFGLTLYASGTGDLKLSAGAGDIEYYNVSWTGTDSQIEVTLLDLYREMHGTGGKISDLKSGDTFTGTIEGDTMIVRYDGQTAVNGMPICRMGDGGMPVDSNCIV